jgi:hypothetical protein
MLEPGGAFVHVGGHDIETPALARPLPHPPPPADDIRRLTRSYLGPERRAGQGVLLHGTPGNEWAVLQPAGFEPPVSITVTGRQVLERTVDDMVAQVFSKSSSAPHLFGDRLGDFEHDLPGPAGRRLRRGIVLRAGTRSRAGLLPQAVTRRIPAATCLAWRSAR